MSRSFSFKQLLIALLKNIKTIVLISLAIALVFGVAAGYKTSMEMKNTTSEEVIERERQVSVLEGNINLLEQRISKSIEKLDESIYLNLDPYNVGQACITFVAYADNKTNEESSLVLAAYSQAYENEDVLNGVRKTLGNANISNEKILELVDIHGVDNWQALTLTVKYSDADTAMLIANDMLNNMKPVVTKAVGNNSYAVISRIKATTDDSVLVTMKQGLEEQIETDQAKLIDYTSELNKLKDDPQYSGVVLSVLMKKTLLMVIAGLLIGMVVGIIIVLICRLSSQKIIEVKDVLNRYKIRYLGTVSRTPKGKLAKKIAVLEDANMAEMDEEQSLEYIKSGLNAAVNGKFKKLLFTGTCEIDEIKKIAKVCASKNDMIGENICKDADSVKMLGDADAVVLVEKIDNSIIFEIDCEVLRIEQTGVPIIGIALV